MLLLDQMTEAEAATLAAIYHRYKTAYDQKDYVASDRARAELVARGAVPPLYTQWQSMYESKEQRHARFLARTPEQNAYYLQPEREGRSNEGEHHAFPPPQT